MTLENWDISVCIVTRLRAGWPGINSRQGQGLSLFRVQTGPVTHKSSYPMATGGKAAGVWSWPLTST